MNITRRRITDVFGEGFQTLQVTSDKEGCVSICLNRPSLRNAFDELMIAELNRVTYLISSRFDPFECRVVHLTGAGTVFCAGADLAMMKAQGEASYEANLEDSRRLAQLFAGVSALPVPVVCSAQGAAIGGGFGLAVCSDIVLTHEDAVFATSEVRLGLIPAVISPYIVRKLGVAASSYPLLSGSRISGSRALEIQLAHVLVPKLDDIAPAASKVIDELLGCAPESVRETKKLLFLAAPLPQDEIIKQTVQAIAKARGSLEAKYGLRCFFQKRLPIWSQWNQDSQMLAEPEDGEAT